ncbi:LysR family transcriptional regulator [Sneathiella sp.]|jgi:DNA-binding transcriptional LysR family regulator|uniref:LysR family transcriptional regulator n=1 Tax=Sneathiella sp. TaxID=1964365 RepID=UPI0039E6A379
MDIYQLRYFLAVVETRNFSRAAERVFVSQPTLSSGIKKLEQDLGVILLNRASRNITLTEAGSRFLPRARTIIYECNTAKQEARGKQPSQRLQIGIPRAFPIAKLSMLLADFGKTHTEMQIALKEGTPEQLDNWLNEERIDMAINVPPTHNSEHQFERLFTTKCVLAVPADHPFTVRSSVQLRQLTGLDFIHRSHCLSEVEITRFFARENINPNIIFRTDEDDKALSLVQSGVGLCVIPDMLSYPGVELVPIDQLNIAKTLGLSWRHGKKNDIMEVFRLFASSHNWKDQRIMINNLEWAR